MADPVTPPAVVTPPATPVAAPVVEIPAAVLERERQIRASQEKVHAERTEVERGKAEIAAWKAERAKEQEAKADPLEKIDKTTKRIETLEESIKKEKAAAALREWQTAKIAEVKAKPDAYELTLLHGYEHLVPARIEAHWNKTGEMLSTDVVAAALEKELEEATEKSLNSKKWKAKSAVPAPTPPPAAQPADKKNGRVAPQTLTNALGGSQTVAPAAGKKLSFADRKAATLAKWEALEAQKKAAAQ